MQVFTGHASNRLRFICRNRNFVTGTTEGKFQRSACFGVIFDQEKATCCEWLHLHNIFFLAHKVGFVDHRIAGLRCV